jgi:hypothetical protein
VEQVSDKRTYRVDVTQTIEVTLDASAFDETFMAEFRDSFYDFDTIEEHAEHIAQMQARGVIDVSYQSGEFIEGYGDHRDMGIAARSVAAEVAPALLTARKTGEGK